MPAQHLDSSPPHLASGASSTAVSPPSRGWSASWSYTAWHSVYVLVLSGDPTPVTAYTGGANNSSFNECVYVFPLGSACWHFLDRTQTLHGPRTYQPSAAPFAWYCVEIKVCRLLQIRDGLILQLCPAKSVHWEWAAVIHILQVMATRMGGAEALCSGGQMCMHAATFAEPSTHLHV